MNIIAVDPGFGNTKVCVEGRVAVLQSAVVRPVEMGGAALGMRVADAACRVSFEGYEFMVGAGAWRWGRPLDSLDFGAIVGPGRLALMYAALANVAQPGDLGDCRLVIGLPVPLMLDEVQMAATKETLRKLKRPHVFTTAAGEYRFTVAALSAVAQPAGAFHDWLYNDELLPREGGARGNIAVLDLGMNTLDLFVIEDGVVQPVRLGGDTVGVRSLLGLISSNGYELAELDDQIRAGKLRPRDTDLDIWLGEVMHIVEKAWGKKLTRFKVVIVAGGGAVLLGRKLEGALAAKGAALHWPADPVATNVKGLWKYGVKHG